MKTCPRCNLSKSSDDFYTGTNRDGRMSWCKDCFCEHKRIKYIADLEGRMSQIVRISDELVLTASDSATTAKAALIRALAV